MILDKNKLENLLLANWADVLNPNEVMKFTLSCVRDNADTFPTMEESELPKKSVQISVSNFEHTTTGYKIWIDFTVPKNNELLVGTVETYFNLDPTSYCGPVSGTRVIGNRFVVKQPPKF